MEQCGSGLDIRYRMLAILSVLSSPQRPSQFQTYVHSALNMGLGPEEIQEVPIPCSLYAGLSSAVNSLEVTHEAFRERGVEAPQAGPRSQPGRDGAKGP